MSESTHTPEGEVETPAVTVEHRTEVTLVVWVDPQTVAAKFASETELGELRAISIGNALHAVDAVQELQAENKALGETMDRFADENDRLSDLVSDLLSALKQFVAYHDAKDDDDVSMMMNYVGAVFAAKAAIEKAEARP